MLNGGLLVSSVFTLLVIGNPRERERERRFTWNTFEQFNFVCSGEEKEEDQGEATKRSTSRRPIESAARAANKGPADLGRFGMELIRTHSTSLGELSLSTS